MEKSKWENYRRAGEIAAKALQIGSEAADEGIKLIDIAESVENAIGEMGGSLAFPVNISINEVAAHYTPDKKDDRAFKSGDLVKLDVGAHVDGCIGDTAKSFVIGSLGEREIDLVNCSRRALNGALKAIRAGITLNEIGSIVENICSAQGFRPVKNLSGHSLERYELHSGISVPNYPNGDMTKIREGMVLAIEPFATDGAGIVKERDYGGIYRHRKESAREVEETDLLARIKGYQGLPFAERWLYDIEGEGTRRRMKKLISRGILVGYRVLVEKNGGYVAQSEHTVLVEKHGCRVITKS